MLKIIHIKKDIKKSDNISILSPLFLNLMTLGSPGRGLKVLKNLKYNFSATYLLLFLHYKTSILLF